MLIKLVSTALSCFQLFSLSSAEHTVVKCTLWFATPWVLPYNFYGKKRTERFWMCSKRGCVLLFDTFHVFLWILWCINFLCHFFPAEQWLFLPHLFTWADSGFWLYIFWLSILNSNFQAHFQHQRIYFWPLIYVCCDIFSPVCGAAEPFHQVVSQYFFFFENRVSIQRRRLFCLTSNPFPPELFYILSFKFKYLHPNKLHGMPVQCFHFLYPWSDLTFFEYLFI